VRATTNPDSSVTLYAGGVAIPTSGGASLGNLASNGFVALGVVVAGGIPGTALVDSTGAVPTAIQGQWIPRTGTAVALATTPLNPGEIAVANDAPKLFVNPTNASAVGKPFPISIIAIATGSATASTANTDYFLPMTAVNDRSGMVDGSGYLLPMPGATYISASGIIQFPYDSTRTKCIVRMQQETALNSGSWGNIDTTTFPNNTVGSLVTKLSVLFIGALSGAGRIRIVVQTDGASVNVNTPPAGILVNQLAL
jgi:hypothetical protein